MPKIAIAVAPSHASPEQRLLWGDRSLSNAELLEVILSSPDAVHELQTRYSTLADIEAAAPAELSELPALGVQGAARLLAVQELSRRRAAERAQRGTPILNAAAAYDLLAPLLRREMREVFLALALDARGRLLCPPITISVGTVSSTLVHPREVFGSLIRVAATSCLVAHLHPSGEPVPSVDDVELTVRLKQAGELLGIPVHDHLVIGDGCFVSMAERGLV